MFARSTIFVLLSVAALASCEGDGAPAGYACGSTSVTDAGTWCLACPEGVTTMTTFSIPITCSCMGSDEPCKVLLNGEESTIEAFNDATTM